MKGESIQERANNKCLGCSWASGALECSCIDGLTRAHIKIRYKSQIIMCCGVLCCAVLCEAVLRGIGGGTDRCTGPVSSSCS